jgi:hypothetical protein
LPDSRLRYCSCCLGHPYRVMPRGLSPCRQQSGRVYFPECADHHRTLSDLLLIYGHIDFVPVEGQNWQHPPFEGKIVDGWVWGRGALDMKGGVAMMLAAFLRAKAEGLTPPGDVLLLVLSDEEAGGDYGAKYLVGDHAGLFDGVRYALGEFVAFPVVSEWCQYRPRVHLRQRAPFARLLEPPVQRHPQLRLVPVPDPESTRRSPPSISVLSLMERTPSGVVSIDAQTVSYQRRCLGPRLLPSTGSPAAIHAFLPSPYSHKFA